MDSMAGAFDGRLKGCATLDEVWALVDELNRRYFPKNRLLPILGGGESHRPKFMFVFINPTARNISSDPSWEGPRFPFIGTGRVWQVFHRAGLLDDALMEQMGRQGMWSPDFAQRVARFLKGKSLYITNLVKWTGRDAALPDTGKIRLFLPFLEREIEIVQPRYIVAFGTIPFKSITKRSITLQDYHADAMKTGKLRPFIARIGSVERKVIPCYFPVGRGNPQKAIELLKLVGSLE